MFEVNINHKVIAIYSREDTNGNNDVDVNGINNDSLAFVEANEGAYHERGIGDVGDDRTLDFANYVSDLPNYAEYANLIKENYKAYVADKGKGKMQEKEVVCDNEVLNATFNLSDDEGGDEFPKFNVERKMEKAELVVGLRDYRATIIDRNHGSVAIVSQKGLDACYLKCTMGGQLMVVVGRDTNNQMYHLVIALVEPECRDSWGWFCETLTDHIGKPHEKGWIFLSDRQKGLINTIEDQFPSVKRRFCVRHMYANFKLNFKDKQLRDIMWTVAKSYVLDSSKAHMREMQAISPDAHA
ncbi:hypothetical protein ACH5RR_027194 [Cinchona calisaya]|uniref:MULE transposase domain-containing protein n=1 Tax=Cinchona calisaya TaxID=153742 RepID=A0ABD2Z7Z3_9GENT